MNEADVYVGSIVYLAPYVGEELGRTYVRSELFDDRDAYITALTSWRDDEPVELPSGRTIAPEWIVEMNG
jgi:hypothetical protein